jgi:hypothetical protein
MGVASLGSELGAWRPEGGKPGMLVTPMGCGEGGKQVTSL